MLPYVVNVVNALFGLFVVAVTLVVWNRVRQQADAADASMGAYVGIALVAIVELFAAGIVYYVGTGWTGMIAKMIGG